jgi:PmbA protein
MSAKSGENLVKAAIEAALAAGAESAEAFFVRSNATTAEVSGGKPEDVKVREGSGVGVRVFVEDRLGFAHTSDLNESGVRLAAEGAVTNAESTFPDKNNVMPETAAEYPDVEQFDAALSSVGLDERIERALLIESSARAVDERIARVRKASISDSSSESCLANSNGVFLCHRGTSCTASILAVAESNGDAQMGWDFDHSPYFNKLEIESVGRSAALRAVEQLGARQIDTTTAPVILDSPVASEFMAAIGHALMADQVQKGKSLFAEKIGQIVASANVTVIDDGCFERGIAPAPADGEGVPSQRTPLIEAGMLKAFLHNTYTASRGDAVSTGNGVRSSYAALPEVGPSNFYLAPGSISRAELIAGCERAFLVTDAMGMHTVDMVSGDFSVGASGLWIEGGEVKYAVREATIAGNVKDILTGVEAVADDLKFYSRYGSPTILVGEVVVGGK